MAYRKLNDCMCAQCEKDDKYFDELSLSVPSSSTSEVVRRDILSITPPAKSEDTKCGNTLKELLKQPTITSSNTFGSLIKPPKFHVNVEIPKTENAKDKVSNVTGNAGNFTFTVNSTTQKPPENATEGIFGSGLKSFSFSNNFFGKTKSIFETTDTNSSNNKSSNVFTFNPSIVHEKSVPTDLSISSNGSKSLNSTSSTDIFNFTTNTLQNTPMKTSLFESNSQTTGTGVSGGSLFTNAMFSLENFNKGTLNSGSIFGGTFPPVHTKLEDVKVTQNSTNNNNRFNFALPSDTTITKVSNSQSSEFGSPNLTNSTNSITIKSSPFSTKTSMTSSFTSLGSTSSPWQTVGGNDGGNGERHDKGSTEDKFEDKVSATGDAKSEVPTNTVRSKLAEEKALKSDSALIFTELANSSKDFSAFGKSSSGKFVYVFHIYT